MFISNKEIIWRNDIVKTNPFGGCIPMLEIFTSMIIEPGTVIDGILPGECTYWEDTHLWIKHLENSGFGNWLDTLLFSAPNAPQPTSNPLRFHFKGRPVKLVPFNWTRHPTVFSDKDDEDTPLYFTFHGEMEDDTESDTLYLITFTYYQHMENQHLSSPSNPDMVSFMGGAITEPYIRQRIKNYCSPAGTVERFKGLPVFPERIKQPEYVVNGYQVILISTPDTALYVHPSPDIQTREMDQEDVEQMNIPFFLSYEETEVSDIWKIRAKNSSFLIMADILHKEGGDQSPRP